MHNDHLTLLVFDDNEEIADAIGGIGQHAGFLVTVATDRHAFQDAIQSHAPHVIVLDLQMPEMDGIEALRVLADQRAQAGILLATGMDERTIVAAEQYGRSQGLSMLGSLQKPFAPEELLEKLVSVRGSIGALTADDLERAISENQLTVHYQPVARRFADGTWDIYSMEALMRWDHPQRGLLAPPEFLKIGETSGLIGPVTDLVIERAVEQLRGWDVARLNLGLRINVPATLIADVDFPDRLECLLAQTQVDPSSLTLELTETGVLDQQPEMLNILTRLRVKDINLSLDDFGIGYSSLTQLFQIPFNEMKIDKSLIAQVPESGEASIMVEALVDLGHKLQLTVCAEGVESWETLSFLNQIACDAAQGFLIGRPIPAGDIPATVRGWGERLQQRRMQEAS